MTLYNAAESVGGHAVADRMAELQNVLLKKKQTIMIGCYE
jgi:hypothetical protein